jgi:hypothetical protein
LEETAVDTREPDRTPRARAQLAKALRRNFPATDFWIKASFRARGRAKGFIMLSWANGPREDEIQALAKSLIGDHVDLYSTRFETCPLCDTPNGIRRPRGELWCVNCDGTSE